MLLPGNRFRTVLAVSSLNFELKSEEEQDAIIDSYESFLNSIDFPLQILIRTREMDLDKYLHDLEDDARNETDKVYKTQLQNYGAFVRRLIKTSRVLTRSFYVVIPYDTKSATDFEVVREQLNVRSDIVSKGLARLGISSRNLTSLEVLDLFYSFYSPEQAKRQPITAQTLGLLHSFYTKRGVLAP